MTSVPKARSLSARVFARFPDLEGPVTLFEEALGLLKFVERSAFRDPSRFEGFSVVGEALRAAVKNLDREWEYFGARLADGSTGGSESVDQAVTLLEYVVGEGFGSCFEQLFPEESDAIHGSASHLIDEWRNNLYAGIERLRQGHKASWVDRYRALKAQHPGSVLMLKMGSFWECLFDDARLVSETLGIVLTQRGRHLEQPIPMCGIPCGPLDRYAARLSVLDVLLCEPRDDGEGWFVRPAFPDKGGLMVAAE